MESYILVLFVANVCKYSQVDANTRTFANAKEVIEEKSVRRHFLLCVDRLLQGAAIHRRGYVRLRQ